MKTRAQQKISQALKSTNYGATTTVQKPGSLGSLESLMSSSNATTHRKRHHFWSFWK